MNEEMFSLMKGTKVVGTSFKEDGTLELKLEAGFQDLLFKVKEQPEEFSVELSTGNKMCTSLRSIFPYDVPISLKFSPEDVKKISEFLEEELAGKGYEPWYLHFGKSYFDGFFFELVCFREGGLRIALRMNYEGAGEPIKFQAFKYVPRTDVDEDECYETRKILRMVEAEGKVEEIYRGVRKVLSSYAEEERRRLRMKIPDPEVSVNFTYATSLWVERNEKVLGELFERGLVDLSVREALAWPDFCLRGKEFTVSLPPEDYGVWKKSAKGDPFSDFLSACKLAKRGAEVFMKTWAGMKEEDVKIAKKVADFISKEPHLIVGDLDLRSEIDVAWFTSRRERLEDFFSSEILPSALDKENFPRRPRFLFYYMEECQFLLFQVPKKYHEREGEPWEIFLEATKEELREG